MRSVVSRVTPHCLETIQRTGHTTRRTRANYEDGTRPWAFHPFCSSLLDPALSVCFVRHTTVGSSKQGCPCRTRTALHLHRSWTCMTFGRRLGERRGSHRWRSTHSSNAYNMLVEEESVGTTPIRAAVRLIKPFRSDSKEREHWDIFYVSGSIWRFC